MTCGRDTSWRRAFLAVSLALAITVMSACSTSPSAGKCTFVEVEHLARPFDNAGKTLICSPKRVSAAYRDQYFPGYEWGDESWTVTR